MFRPINENQLQKLKDALEQNHIGEAHIEAILTSSLPVFLAGVREAYWWAHPVLGQINGESLFSSKLYRGRVHRAITEVLQAEGPLFADRASQLIAARGLPLEDVKAVMVSMVNRGELDLTLKGELVLSSRAEAISNT